MNGFSNLKLLCVFKNEDDFLKVKEAASLFPVFSSIEGENDANKALSLVASKKYDVIIMDYSLNNLEGEMTFSNRLHYISSSSNLIFASDSQEDAYDAWKTPAVGFILKPITEDDILKQLLKIYRYCFKDDKKLMFRCFGNFECFFRGEPVKFERKQCKEFVAYLIDRRGAAVSENEIRAILWEDAEDSASRKSYLRTIASAVRKTFEDLGQGEVFSNDHGTYRIDMDKVKCDYFEYLKGDKENYPFRGEYMMQYSWAEETTASLEFEMWDE